MNNLFGFSAFTQPETSHISSLAHGLADAFLISISSKEYGDGVKQITANLVLTDPNGTGRLHKVKRARYLPGKRTIKAHGLVVSIENVLEFTLRPSYAALCHVRTEAQLACAILPEVELAKSDLVRLSIPDFDLDMFLSDFAVFLERACRQGLSVH